MNITLPIPVFTDPETLAAFYLKYGWSDDVFKAISECTNIEQFEEYISAAK